MMPCLSPLPLGEQRWIGPLTRAQQDQLFKWVQAQSLQSCLTLCIRGTVACQAPLSIAMSLRSS